MSASLRNMTIQELEVFLEAKEKRLVSLESQQWNIEQQITALQYALGVVKENG